MPDDEPHLPPSGINKQEGLKSINNVVDSYQRFLDAFLFSLPEYQTNIQKSVKQQDFLQLHYYCHQLYSVSISVGALRLATICHNILDIENIPENKRLAQLCKQLVDELEIITTNTNHNICQDQLTQAATPDKAASTQKPQALPLENIRILLVEDEINLAELLTTTLAIEGAVVEQLLTEKAAVQRLSDREQPTPNTLICDIKLLDGCGFKVAKQFSSRYPDSPIVLMSGELPEPEKLAGLAHIELITLLKPFLLSELRGYLVKYFNIN